MRSSRWVTRIAAIVTVSAWFAANDTSAHATQCPGTFDPAASTNSPYQLPDATVGVPYTFTVHQSGATTPYWQQLDSNPPGITQHPGLAPTYVIDGTPTMANTYNLNVALYDQSVPSCLGNVALYKLTVRNPPPDAGPDASSDASTVGDGSANDASTMDDASANDASAEASTVEDASTSNDASATEDASTAQDASTTEDASACVPEGGQCKSNGDCCFIEPLGATCALGICRSNAPEAPEAPDAATEPCVKINEMGCRGRVGRPGTRCCTTPAGAPAICDLADGEYDDNPGICCVPEGTNAESASLCCSGKGTPTGLGVTCGARSAGDQNADAGGLCGIVGGPTNATTGLFLAFGIGSLLQRRLRRRKDR